MKIQNLPSSKFRIFHLHKLSEYGMIITELINEKPQKTTVALSIGGYFCHTSLPKTAFQPLPNYLGWDDKT